MSSARRFTLLGFAVALTTILLLSACGGGGDEGASDSTTEASDSTTEAQTTPETVINDADQALAESSLLRLSDFPTGWRATNEDEEDDPTALEGCFTADFAGVTVTGRAEADDFESGSSTQASSVTAVYADAAAAEKVYTQFSDGTLAECVASYLEEQPSEDGVEITSAEAGQLSFPALGEESDARQIAVEVESQGLTPSAYVDLVGIRDGRVFSLLLFFDVLSPFSPDQEVELARKVETRMAAGG